MAVDSSSRANVGYSPTMTVTIKAPIQFNLTIPSNNVFTQGDRLKLMLDIQNLSTPLMTDIYFVIIDPQQNIFSAMGWENGIKSLYVNYLMPENLDIKDIPLCNLILPCEKPPIEQSGNYFFAIIAIETGTERAISNVETVHFRVN